jgi:hypothetical protein
MSEAANKRVNSRHPGSSCQRNGGIIRSLLKVGDRSLGNCRTCFTAFQSRTGAWSMSRARVTSSSIQSGLKRTSAPSDWISLVCDSVR